MALLEFLPESHCTTAMQLRLFVSEQSRDGGDDDQRDQATDIWLTSLLGFLEEDRKLVEQRSAATKAASRQDLPTAWKIVSCTGKGSTDNNSRGLQTHHRPKPRSWRR